MEIQFIKSGSISELKKALATLLKNKSVKSILMLACDENNYLPSTLDPVLKNVKVPIIGGIFPGIIYEAQKLMKGTILAGLPEKLETNILKNISNIEDEDYLSLTNFDFDFDKTKTILMFVDGFSQKIGKLIESLFFNYGLAYNYLGGGAGSLSMEQSPCVVTNEGLLTDSAILAYSCIETGIGVKHGWNSIAGPFKITGAKNNIIISLDFRPAFEVYKEVVDLHSKKQITSENFFEISKSFPFGITKLNAEKVVRDPIKVDNYNNIICVGELNEGSYVHILTGNNASLINAAREAKKQSIQSLGKEKFIGFTLFVDCISRVLFLEQEFEKEVQAIQGDINPTLGALTLGEIANNGKDYLEFYNKTSVVGSFKF
ncbi:MAG: FIST C-terminal domain-containing protein [Bacteroidales bacterium]|nr:FIST C-terminal domain-containing protein [Bacteroidales bacterium]MCF8405601.1 FIST C-terminal domain-containing protein [Bacteroidales bacterium]